MVFTYGLCGSEHEFCIIDTVSEFMNRGYVCYLEYEIILDRKRGFKLVVDVLAIKKEQRVLIEVGTLSSIHGDRLKLLKTLRPKAKIIHITQWKNFITKFDWDDLNLYPWKRESLTQDYVDQHQIEMMCMMEKGKERLRREIES